VSDICNAKDKLKKKVLICNAHSPNKPSKHENGPGIFTGGCCGEMACAVTFLQC
jgi:hypothetical protein